MLDDNNTKATFFVLGYVAECSPGLIKEIADQGHEIGTHGYGHEFVYKMTPEEFASDLKLSIDLLEQTIRNISKFYCSRFIHCIEQNTCFTFLTE